ncbi:MAG: methylated-DNA--[protein]-cysteine S-methyltransferase [Prevotellaceae bacterium]|jgi:AraC family transcriptional regulator of adaptative response/methylated-DNA-[protein]-cysteine methyltransferase|nr:methylated-DNA--[protein]-cysteine S-methyltransferase [Prevotellaceae bacterium]
MKTKREIFYKALVQKNSAFEGIFIVAVKTTGIFCLSTCLTKPKMENVEFYPTTKDALASGYRACKVCKPMEQTGKLLSDINLLLRHIDSNPSVEVKDADIKKMGLEPGQVNKWALESYNLTFSDFQHICQTDNAFQQPQSEKGKNKKFDCGSLNELNRRFEKIIGKNKKMISITLVETGVGTMIAGATDKGICLLEFSDSKKLEPELKQLITLFKAPLIEGDNIYFNALREQLGKYFKGELRKFSVPLDLKGTDFQVHAWLGLLNIPYGSTTTYAKQAEALGRPSAVRAVANANGKNRISIILPCHRVIGTDGNLTGYGGEIWRKKKLLELERNA